jgi:hypothetical protein
MEPSEPFHVLAFMVPSSSHDLRLKGRKRFEMMSMSRNAMLLMALMLAAATAATAATAFAGSKKPAAQVSDQVADAVTTAASAARTAKIRTLVVNPNTQKR